MYRKLIGMTVLALGLATVASAQDKVLTMGYKDDAKLPFIGDAKDNSGAYLDLYTKAAKAIGYELKVVRAPKKRILADIEAGKIDFWPGADFDQDRAKYMCFLENGFMIQDVGITRADVPELKDISKFKGSMLVELGSTKGDLAKTYPGLKIETISGLTLPDVPALLTAKRGDIYIDDSPVIEYFEKTKGIKDLSSLGLKTHYGILGEPRKMYVGFSQKSDKLKSEPNPAYESKKPISIENFPIVVSKDCVAAQFAAALLKLKKDGEAQKIYDKHFKQ